MKKLHLLSRQLKIKFLSVRLSASTYFKPYRHYFFYVVLTLLFWPVWQVYEFLSGWGAANSVQLSHSHIDIVKNGFSLIPEYFLPFILIAAFLFLTGVVLGYMVQKLSPKVASVVALSVEQEELLQNRKDAAQIVLEREYLKKNLDTLHLANPVISAAEPPTSPKKKVNKI